MDISFPKLIQVYRESKPIDGLEWRSFDLKKDEDLLIIKKLSSEDNFEMTNLEINGDVQLGHQIQLKFGAPKLQFGRFFETIKDMIKGDIAQLHKQPVIESPYFIKEGDILSVDEAKHQILVSYDFVKHFLQKFITMSSYVDNTSKRLVFFSKRIFLLSIDVSNEQQITEFVQLLQNLNDEQHTKIDSFQKWFNDEETSRHIDEKKSILAFVLSDIFSHDAHFIDVIKQIAYIYESVQAQYALYLENFSYEKFVKKLEENTEKFVSKINDTINKVLPQFLGLPFLTAVPSMLKSGDNWLIYIALIVYCAMCYLALSYQKTVLNHIQEDVDSYEEKGKIPEKLKNQWNEDKRRIKKLLNKQNKLYKLLNSSLCLCLVYGVFQFLYYLLKNK